jgi:branched-chain amino acid transport system substrate-binding protein
MKDQKGAQGSNGMSRRDFLKKTSLAGASLGTAAMFPTLARKALAANRDYILIGQPGAYTGPIAAMTEPSRWVAESAVAAVNKQGGIYIKELGKNLPVRVKLVDTEGSATKAAELANRLIVRDKVDMMYPTGTPAAVNPASVACERHGVPCVGYCPLEPWLVGGPYKWSFLFFWSVGDLVNLFTGMWDQYADKTNKVVGGLWDNSEDGGVWAQILPKELEKLGYRVVDPGRFPLFQKDFTSSISLFKKEKVEILTGNLIPPDWATAWRQMRQQGYLPKIATIGKAIVFPMGVNALGGNLPMGLTTELWWSPSHPFKSSLTGQSSQELADAWTKETGKQWTQPIGFEHTAWEIMMDSIKRAGTLNKGKIREAMAKTNLESVVGPIKFDARNFASTPPVGGQWVKGKKWPWDLQVVYNKLNTRVPLEGKMMFPLPK